MGCIADHYDRAKQIYLTEGLVSLLRRGFRFLVYCLIEYRSYYLTEHGHENIQQLKEADFMPKVDDFTFKIVTSSQEADELEAHGYEFRSYPHGFDDRKALDSGAIASCIFVGRELAAIGWVALAQEAMDSLNERPMKVDFSGEDALIGAVWTNPKYRRMGFRAYRVFKLRQFLLDKGIATTRGYSTKGNIAALVSGTRIGDIVYAEGRYLRILWWKSWRERPMSAEEQEAMRQTNGSHS